MFHWQSNLTDNLYSVLRRILSVDGSMIKFTTLIQSGEDWHCLTGSQWPGVQSSEWGPSAEGGTVLCQLIWAGLALEAGLWGPHIITTLEAHQVSNNLDTEEYDKITPLCVELQWWYKLGSKFQLSRSSLDKHRRQSSLINTVTFVLSKLTDESVKHGSLPSSPLPPLGVAAAILLVAAIPVHTRAGWPRPLRPHPEMFPYS